MRLPVSAETQLAVTLYYLSDAGRMRKTANAFGPGKSTVSNIVVRVCTAIRERVTHLVLTIPSTEQEVTIMTENFLKNYGFPQCLGRWYPYIHKKSNR